MPAPLPLYHALAQRLHALTRPFRALVAGGRRAGPAGRRAERVPGTALRPSRPYTGIAAWRRHTSAWPERAREDPAMIRAMLSGGTERRLWRQWVLAYSRAGDTVNPPPGPSRQGTPRARPGPPG